MSVSWNFELDGVIPFTPAGFDESAAYGKEIIMLYHHNDDDFPIYDDFPIWEAVYHGHPQLPTGTDPNRDEAIRELLGFLAGQGLSSKLEDYMVCTEVQSSNV